MAASWGATWSGSWGGSWGFVPQTTNGGYLLLESSSHLVLQAGNGWFLLQGPFPGKTRNFALSGYDGTQVSLSGYDGTDIAILGYRRQS